MTNSFGYQLSDLVGTPGTFQTIAQIWLFFLKKLSFQWHIGVRWPAFYVNFLRALEFLSSKFPSFGMIPEDCVFTAQLLLAPALLARFVYVQSTRNKKKRIWHRSQRRGTGLRHGRRGFAHDCTRCRRAGLAFRARHCDWRTNRSALADGAGRCSLLAHYRLCSRRARGAHSTLEGLQEQVRGASRE